MKNIYTTPLQSTLEYGAVIFGMIALRNIDRLQVYQNYQNQGTRLILGVLRGTSVRLITHELHMLPVEHRTKVSRAKLYWKIGGNIKHPLHTTINRRQRNGWTTEIHEYQRFSSKQYEEPTQLQTDDTNYHTNVLKERLLEYISSQPDDNTYYTDGSIDGTRVPAAVVLKEEDIFSSNRERQ